MVDIEIRPEVPAPPKRIETGNIRKTGMEE